jgi:hypothetical protein
MRLALWPGGGGEPADLAPLEPALRAASVEPLLLDPEYATRSDWSIETLAGVLAATGADAFGGASWGGAVAATAAVQAAPRALVLIDGGHFGGPDFSPAAIDEVLASADDLGWRHGAETLEPIFRAYENYDATQTLTRLDRATRVLLVAAGKNELSTAVLPRFEELVPWGDVRVVDSGHDIVEEMPDELGRLVGEWLAAA